MKSQYPARDPLHACVYILCLHSVVSNEDTSIKIPQNFNSYNHLQKKLFCKVIHNKHGSVEIKSWNNS